MRPDVALIGAFMFPTVSLARHGRGLPSAKLVALVLPFPVSDLCIALLPRSGVLSRHDTDVQVTPPGLAPPSGLSSRLA